MTGTSRLTTQLRAREQAAPGLIVVLSGGDRDHDEGHRGERGDDEQPHAGARVDRLAQLDAREAQERGALGERHAAERAGDGGGERGHAATSVGAASVAAPLVRDRNSSSSPAPSAGRSSTSTTPAKAAARPTASGSASTSRPPSVVGDALRPALTSASSSASGSSPRTIVPDAARSSVLLPWATIRPLPMTMRSSAIASISRRRWEDRRTVPPRSAKSRSRPAHPGDALGVQPVRRLVEDQHRRLAHQGVRDAEPLAHAERVVADALARRARLQADVVQQLGHAAARRRRWCPRRS